MGARGPAGTKALVPQESSRGRRPTLAGFAGHHNCQLEDVRLESCGSSFSWGKPRTAVREAAPQVALRDGSKAAVGEVNV